jgi:methionine sulfoxide reductase heme-binding subunit
LIRPSILAIKRVVFVAALLPACALVYDGFTGDLTANPVDYITDETGTWALALLTISLAVTPLRRLFHWNEAIKLRRMLGLFAFFYAVLHVATWFGLVSFFDVATMIEDVLERPFITVGMLAFVILLALALTSTTASIRRLGRRWQQLHRLVYVAGVGAVVHFTWLVKADIAKPMRWAVALGLLLGFRLWWTLRSRVLVAPKS